MDTNKALFHAVQRGVRVSELQLVSTGGFKCTYSFAAVSLGKHDHAATVSLEGIHIGIHAPGCCWPKRSTSIALKTKRRITSRENSAGQTINTRQSFLSLR